MSVSQDNITVITMQTVKTLKEDITAFAEKGLQAMVPTAQVYYCTLTLLIIHRNIHYQHFVVSFSSLMYV